VAQKFNGAVHLKRAGITRPELFAATATSIPLRFHELRASGISHLAMLPELTVFDVRDYAGHCGGVDDRPVT